MEWWLGNIGLILNLIGSLLIAFSIHAHPSGAHVMHEGKKWPIACVSSVILFWIGVFTMIVGFACTLLWSYARTYYMCYGFYTSAYYTC